MPTAWLTPTGVVISCLVIFAAPLVIGSVHRPVVLIVALLTTIGAAAILLGELSRHALVRVTPAVALPLVFLLVPLIQSVPLPTGIARRIDRAADDLLVESPVAGDAFRPLSLDPPETRAIIAKAGAGLAVFLLAFHLASSRSRRRQLLLRVVAASAVVAMAIGLGHRILGEDLIFGRFPASMGLLNGPFINRNHLAEFLGLGAFACVASALAGSSALNRVGWLAAALLAGACALGTLSRGAILSLAAGTIVFVWLRQAAVVDAADREAGEHAKPQRTMLWVTLMLLCLGAVAIGLGADQLVNRVRDTQITQEMRFRLWKDSLRVLAAHPFGIGRGAFDRVFPAYRTVETGIEIRFGFVENEPLQCLIEMGWLGFFAVATAAVFVAREWLAARRRDQTEAALVACIVAVLVHNLVDFGLETLGVSLPFAAMLGTLLGRARYVPERALPPRLAIGAWAAALCAMVIGGASLARASSRNFDAALDRAPPGAARRGVALQAQAAHPVDYFYVLAQAANEPVTADATGRSPRLHALNHALSLCPRCPDVHSAVASTLWALGRRRQALVEWRAAIETSSTLFELILHRVWAAGARPEELAVIAGAEPQRLTRVASFLLSRGQPQAAQVVLPLATEAGAPSDQILLIKAELEIASGAIEEALKSLDSARKLVPQEPRVFLLLSDANMRAGRVDQALADLDTGIGMNPHDVSLLRKRLNLVMGYRKWFLAKGALEALEVGLAEAGLPTTEVHIQAGRYYATLHENGKATSEYTLALSQNPGDAAVWAEMGALWESTGRVGPALEAYRQANTVSPGNAAVVGAISRLTTRIHAIRSGAGLEP